MLQRLDREPLHHLASEVRSGRTSQSPDVLSRAWHPRGDLRGRVGELVQNRPTIRVGLPRNGLAYPVCMADERITIDPGRRRGLPCISDTGLMVSAVLGQLAAGRFAERVLDDCPDLERADILASLQFAPGAVQGHELPLARPA